jgi:hypothetical protein
MNTYVRDPMQEAALEAGGVEGSRLHHNCKTGLVYLDGAEVDGLRAVFLMEEAEHGWLQFDEKQKPVDKSIVRYADEKPDRSTRLGSEKKPNTSCLCVVEGTAATATYTGSSWAVRYAFEGALLKPYARLKQRNLFPVVRLGFKPGHDEHGNYLPSFDISGWEPRSKYAFLLGESEATPKLEAPERKPLLTVTSGQPAEARAGTEQNGDCERPTYQTAIDEHDAGSRPFAPVSSFDDEIPFAPERR